MGLQEVLAEKRSDILSRWRELMAQSHPGGPAIFKEKDRFANPIGYTFSTESKVILDEFLRGRVGSEPMVESLEGIGRITAVQDYSAGQAVAFVFQLKEAIRHELKSALQEEDALRELVELEMLIDEIALLAFEAYTRCREKIHQVRVREIQADRDNAFRLLERSASRGEAIEDR